MGDKCSGTAVKWYSRASKLFTVNRFYVQIYSCDLYKKNREQIVHVLLLKLRNVLMLEHCPY